MLEKVRSNHLRIFLIKILRFCFRTFWLFPVRKNRVFFSSYYGKQYSCNPKYIFECLRERVKTRPACGRPRYVWCLNHQGALPESCADVTVVRHYSLLWFYYVLTSKVIVVNQQLSVFLPIRNSQVVINTWHGGGAYKKVALENREENKPSSNTYNHYHYKLINLSTTFFISSCRAFTDIMSNSFMMEKDKFVPIGMPRNDVFFRESEAISRIIRERLGIQYNVGIVLYAPTFRGGFKNSQTVDFTVDVNSVLAALKERFQKEFAFVFRDHYINSTTTDAAIIDATGYPDMQELLCAADVLITDYSSSVWDFSLTGKPGFLYTPDLSTYRDERDFYTPIEEWPFPFAETNEELRGTILSFSETELRAKIRRHHEALGSYENGTASARAAEIIMDALG